MECFLCKKKINYWKKYPLLCDRIICPECLDILKVGINYVRRIKQIDMDDSLFLIIKDMINHSKTIFSYKSKSIPCKLCGRRSFYYTVFFAGTYFLCKECGEFIMMMKRKISSDQDARSLFSTAGISLSTLRTLEIRFRNWKIKR
ncbi:MAG: hypothetical protein ACTSQY_00540 [Candidatus Odinarchaeia archaeon]|nr:MAG: hypothetical protein [Lokiarchaeota virus Fenrir Meg22_1012]URC17289.1 MAG: hypothetical protein [Lokiarchaeota virus Fenrir Meg22_1214]